VYTINSANVDILFSLGRNYAWLGQYEEALKFYKKLHERAETQEGF